MDKPNHILSWIPPVSNEADYNGST
jgi:hypothetical protein